MKSRVDGGVAHSNVKLSSQPDLECTCILIVAVTSWPLLHSSNLEEMALNPDKSHKERKSFVSGPDDIIYNLWKSRKGGSNATLR